MIAAAFVLALGILTMLFAARLERQRNPNGWPDGVEGGGGIVTVTLAANRQGHYLANGSINGRTVEFLVDTGATTIAVPQVVAERIGLKPGAPMTVVTAAGPARAYATRIESVVLGGIERRDLPATIVPRMSGGEVLLGMNFLGTLEFAQRGNQLELRGPAR